jgi:hypothetical protein
MLLGTLVGDRPILGGGDRQGIALAVEPLQIPVMGDLGTVVLAFSLGATTGDASTAPPGWHLEFELNGFFQLSERGYLAPVASADRGPLHLEARYNYEDLHTATFSAGWSFRRGSEDTSLRVAPLLGGAVGRSPGVLPGLELEAEWWRLSYSLELEYLFNVKDSSESFFYTWSELTLEVTSFLWVGGSWQRFKQARSDRELDVGPMIGGGFGPVSLSFYYYGLGTSERWALVSLDVRFPKGK